MDKDLEIRIKLPSIGDRYFTSKGNLVNKNGTIYRPQKNKDSNCEFYRINVGEERVILNRQELIKEFNKEIIKKALLILTGNDKDLIG